MRLLNWIGLSIARGFLAVVLLAYSPFFLFVCKCCEPRKERTKSKYEGVLK